MPRRHLFWILLAFAVSVGVRAPLIDRPLSAHHEYCTALVLIVLHNWHVDGSAAHHGAPAITFSGPADLIPPGYTDEPTLRDGVLYYLSHPPLAYDLPHLLFSLTGTAPNALGLQLFNVFFHLLTAIGLYLIIRELLTERTTTNAPLFGAVLYLFMPAPLWFHSNAYMSDMFVQNAWVWHVFVVLRMYRTNATGWRWPVLVGLTLFITTCISWPGVWAGMVLCCIALLRWWRTRERWELRVMLVAVTGVGLALGYTAWRWLQVVDPDALLAYFGGRFAERRTSMNSGLLAQLLQLLTNYRTGYLPVILIAIGVIFRWQRWKDTSKHWRLFLAVAAAPVVLDHLLLLNYAGHDFAALKGGVLLCTLGGLGIAALPPRWALAGLMTTCVAGVLYFYRTNPLPGSDGDRYVQEKEMGLGIGQEALPNETVFRLGFTAEPQVQWYAKRTLFRVDSLPQARLLLEAQGTPSGVVFRLEDGHLVHERIALP